MEIKFRNGKFRRVLASLCFKASWLKLWHNNALTQRGLRLAHGVSYQVWEIRFWITWREALLLICVICVILEMIILFDTQHFKMIIFVYKAKVNLLSFFYDVAVKFLTEILYNRFRKTESIKIHCKSHRNSTKDL